MPGRDEDAWGGIDSPKGRGQGGLFARGLSVSSRALEAEADRWFLWLPVLFASATAASYSVENWLLADGDARDASAATDEGLFRCNPLGCVGTVKGKTAALVRRGGALEEDCRVADIIIAPFTVTKRCRARVIVDRRVLKAEGAHALYVEGLSIRT